MYYRIGANGQYIGADGRTIDPSTIDPNTGAPVQANPQNAPDPNANPFSADYMAKHADQMQQNPYNPGTDAYKNFQDSQIQQMNEMAGAPARPEFHGLTDPNTGLMKSQYQLTPGQINFSSVMDPMRARLDQIQLNKDPLHALEAESTRSGPSAWANLMKDQVEQNKQASLDKVSGQANGANATALSNLSMRGGLNSGARTSLAKDMARNINAGSQNVSRAADSDKLNINIEDELKRMGVLSQLPGQELASIQPEMQKASDLNAASITDQARNLDTQKANVDLKTQAQQYNIGNALNQNTQSNAFDMGKYNELMKAYAANKQGDAMAGSGGGGSSFLCGELRKRGLMTMKETIRMTQFMLRAVFYQWSFMGWYLKNGPELLRRMERAPWDLLKYSIVGQILWLEKQFGTKRASQQYVRVTMGLATAYYPESMNHKICKPTLWMQIKGFFQTLSKPLVWKAGLQSLKMLRLGRI